MSTIVNNPTIISSSNDNSLDKKEPFFTLEKQKSVSSVGRKKEKSFNIPLSIFRCKSYDFDFFISWYNILTDIFEEIRKMCPEKRMLNLALSVLMLPYIVSVSLGLLVYNRSKADCKIQAILGGNKIKKSEVSEKVKKLIYGVFTAIAIFVSVVILVVLIIPATLALAIFYLSNKKLSHSLIATLNNWLCVNDHQSIEISFHEVDVGESDIRWDMEIKFPRHCGQLLKDLYKDKSNKLFVRRVTEHTIIVKLSANIHLKNGLKPLSSEIRYMLATLIEGVTEAMGGLLKLDEKDVTYDKLKGLLSNFRLKIVNSADPKLTSYLVRDAYRVAFIQTIKFVQEERKKNRGFSLEERLKEVLVEQELKSQGKELPTKEEIIIEDLRNVGIEIPKNLKDEEFSPRKATWEKLIREGKIGKRTVIDVCEGVYPTETKKVLDNARREIETLRKVSGGMCKKLEEMFNRGKGNLRKGVLKRKLEDLFKFEGNDQDIEKRLIRSVIKIVKDELTQSVWSTLNQNKEKQNLMKRLEDLEKEIGLLISNEALDKINGFIERMYLEIKQHKVQQLLQEQKEGVLDLCETLKEYEPSLAGMIEAFRKQGQGHLEVEKTLEDQNERLEDKINKREEKHPCTKSIKVLLKRNSEILEELAQLELKKEELLINEKTKNDYREELTYREKIKFAIMEDKLLEIIKASSEDELLKVIEEIFDRSELLQIKETFKDKQLEIIEQIVIKKLLEKAELEYCLAEKCIRNTVIKTKDNVKHFCQVLLSPLIDNLVKNIINNVPKNGKSSWLQPRKSLKTAYGYLKTGLDTAIYGNETLEGRALDVAHYTYKEVETLLKYFESSYEEVGSLVGDVFSDDSEIFKKDLWPQIKDHLLRMWDRFSKDVEFKLVSKDESKVVARKLDWIDVTQLQQILAV